jgi:DNA-binding winged helix-turn-helix (wHTH) protein
MSMKVAVISNEVVEWRALTGSEPTLSALWHRDNLLSLLEENAAEAIMFMDVPEGLELACTLRRCETYQGRPIALLSSDPTSRSDSQKPRGDCGHYLMSTCSAPELNDKPRRLRVDRRAREIWVDNGYHSCSPMEFRLLLFFLQYPRIVFSREELVKRVRLEESLVDARIIDVLVLRLRRKIEASAESPRCLRTVPRLGYVFEYNGDSFIDVETNTPLPA